MYISYNRKVKRTMNEKIYKLTGRRRFGRLKKDIPTEITVSAQTVSVKVKLKTKRNILTGEEADIKTEKYRFQKTDVSGMEFTRKFRWFVLDFVQLALVVILAALGFQYFWWLLLIVPAYVFLFVRCRHLVITLKSGQKIKIPVMDESSAEELLEELEDGMHASASENVTVGSAPGNVVYGSVPENTVKHIYCSNCGKELPEGFSVCTGCGAPLGGQRQTGSKKMGLIIAAAAGVVLLLGGTISFFLFNTFSKDSGTSGETAKKTHKTHTSMEDVIKEQAEDKSMNIETALSFYEERYEQEKANDSTLSISLIYLNDDEIPECVIMNDIEGVILSYVGGNFIETRIASEVGSMELGYAPKSGIYCTLSLWKVSTQSITEYFVSKLTNKFEHEIGLAWRDWHNYSGYVEDIYNINGKDVSSEEYEAYIDSLGLTTYISYEDQYNSVQEAYNALVN